MQSSVVKSVRWRHEGGSFTSLFASAGNDAALVVCDVRQRDAAAARVDEAHASAINSIRWHPHEPLLLSSSFGPQLLLHDVRKLDRALFVFEGHVAPQ